MKIIINNWIPFKKFTAINLFGIVFARRELSEQIIRHEQIHTYQMREMLYIFFYIWYGVEWLIRLIHVRDFKKTYYSISFEKEAFNNQSVPHYSKFRKLFEWFKYI